MAKRLTGSAPAEGKFGGVVNAAALERFVQEIEIEVESRSVITKRLAEIYDAARGAGFNTTILREIVKERRQGEDARQARYNLLDVYRKALGMYADTPLGQAAMQRAEAEEAEAVAAAANGHAARPRPFAEQPVHPPRRRGRPPKAQPGALSVDEALAKGRAHLEGEEPAGTA